MRYVLLGNILLIFFALNALGVSTDDCTLEVRNADGLSVSTIGLGVPFQVVVTVQDCAEQPKVVFNQSPFSAIRQVSVQTRSMNGYTSVSYVYSARIDALGTYTIGPARVTVAGHEYHTNSLVIDVSTQKKTVGNRFMMQLALDDGEVYVGQQTTLRVRIYSATASLDVEAIHIAQLDGVMMGEFTQTSSGTEYQDGIKYCYKEFTASIYAQKAGTFLIPAFSSDVRDDQARRGGFFFFSLIAPTKQIFSNTVSLVARTVPVTSTPTSLVGEYTQVVASAEPALVELGQAVRYRLTVYGKGNAAVAKAPLLSDIPSSCKYYDSSVIPLPNQEGVVFEYVIQPRQAGTWEIPEQKIVYFSPALKKTCTLCCEPVVITAQGREYEAKKTEAAEKSGTSLSAATNVVLQQYHPDLSSADPRKSTEFIIPWFWYWFMVIGLLIALLGLISSYYVHALFSKNYVYYRRYRAFYTARRALRAVEQGKSTISLHQIFTTLFADWFMVAPSEVTEAFIRRHMASLGILSEDGVESWHHFWHTIVQEQYGIAKNRKVDKTVYAEARLWITAFSKFSA